MSARRIALEQPASFAFQPDTLEKANWWLSKYPADRKSSGLIPILWLVQKQEGWVSEPAMRLVGEMLGMPRIRVLEVATFYTMFHLEPVGRHHLQVCGTPPCALRGAELLKEVCKRRIGPKHTPTNTGLFSWEEVECMGACVNAPIVAIDDYYYEDLAPEDLEKLMDALARGEAIAPGSARGRQTSAHRLPALRWLPGGKDRAAEPAQRRGGAPEGMMTAEREGDAPEQQAPGSEPADFAARRRDPLAPMRGPFAVPPGSKVARAIIWLYLIVAVAMGALFAVKAAQSGLPAFPSMLWILPAGAFYFVIRALMVARPRLR
jgi:NADH-quinone oxidoreductase subunit E